MTTRQQQVLDLIRRSFEEKGYAPSIREVAQGLGVAITAAVGHLRSLERQGHIIQDKGRARGIRLTEPTRCRSCGQPLGGKHE